MFITKYTEEDYINFADNVSNLLPEIYKSSGLILAEMDKRNLITREFFYKIFLKIQKDEYKTLNSGKEYFYGNRINNFIWNKLEYFFEKKRFNNKEKLEKDFYKYVINQHNIEDLFYPILFIRKITGKAESNIDNNPAFINFIIGNYKERQGLLSKDALDNTINLNNNNLDIVIDSLTEQDIIKNGKANIFMDFGNDFLDIRLQELPEKAINRLKNKQIKDLDDIDVFLMTIIMDKYGLDRDEYQELSFDVHDFFIEKINTDKSDRTQTHSVKMRINNFLIITQKIIQSYRNIKIENVNDDLNDILTMHAIKNKLESILKHDVLRTQAAYKSSRYNSPMKFDTLIDYSVMSDEIYNLFNSMGEMQLFVYLWKHSYAITNTNKNEILEAKKNLEDKMLKVLNENQQHLQNQAEIYNFFYLKNKEKENSSNNSSLQLIFNNPHKILDDVKLNALNLLSNIDDILFFNKPLLKEAFEVYYKDFIAKENNISDNILKKLFRASILLNEPIDEREVHSYFMNGRHQNYLVKTEFLIDIYEKNINNIAFFWQSIVWKDVYNLHLMESWLKNNLHRISNIDLEAIYAKVNDGDRNIFFKEIFRRKKNNIVVEKIYELSFIQQKIVFFENTINHEVNKNSILNCFTLINPENFVKFAKSVDFNKEVLENYQIENVLGDKLKSFLENIQQQKFDVCLSLDEVFCGTGVMLQEKDKKNDVDNLIFLENGKHISQLTRNYYKVWDMSKNEQALNLFYAIKKMIKENGLDKALEMYCDEIGELLYLLKKKSSELTDVSEELFWKKYVFNSLFTMTVEKSYEIKSFDKIAAYRKHIVPDYLQEQSFIKSGLTIMDDVEKRFNGENVYDIRKLDNIFVSARNESVIGENEKYLITNEKWNNIKLDHVIDVFEKKVDHVILLDLALPDNSLRNSENFEKLNKLLKLAINNILYLNYAYKLFFEYNKAPYYPKEDGENGSYLSRDKKVEIFKELLNSTEYYLNNEKDYLNLFVTILNSLGGRKGVEEYIKEENVKIIFDEKDIAMLYFYYSKVLLDEQSKESLKYFRNLEDIYRENEVFAKENDYTMNRELSIIFTNEKFNIGSIIREINLLEDLSKIKKENSLITRKKI